MTSDVIQAGTGYLLIPFTAAVPFFQAGILRYNYTGLLNQPDTRQKTMFCLALCGIWLLYLLDQTGKKNHPDKWGRVCIAAAALSILTVLVPYSRSMHVLSGIHILLGYLLFLYTACMVLHIIWPDRTLLCWYLSIVLFCLLIAVSADSVNGLCEWIYISFLSILLTHIVLTQKHQ